MFDPRCKKFSESEAQLGAYDVHGSTSVTLLL